MDLWEFGLTPQEYMAAHYMERCGGRITGREVAVRLQVSEATGLRVLASLTSKGLIQRLTRGRYALCWMTVEQSPVTVKQSPVTVANLLSSTSTSHIPIAVPIGTAIGAAPLSEGQKEFSEKRFPVADDLEPGRLSPTPAPQKKTLFKQPDKFHRLTQPMETWGISHVVKEFGIRSQHAAPKSVYVPEGKKLSVTLHMAQREYGLTVPQMIAAVDQFFTHRAHNVPDNVAPTRHFLMYLKTFIEQQPGFKGTVNLDADGEPAGWDRFNKKRGWE